MPVKELKNIGCLKKVTLPDGWQELPRPAEELADKWQRKFHSMFDMDVELLFYFRGAAVDSNSAAQFKELLQSKPARANDEKLTPAEIISMQIIMGFEHAGNNQYSNPDSASFDLQTACTKSVSGRTVLFVKGHFLRGKHYAGIFFNTDPSCEIIEELMIQAPSSSKVQQYSNALESILSTIEWR